MSQDLSNRRASERHPTDISHFFVGRQDGAQAIGALAHGVVGW